MADDIIDITESIYGSEMDCVDAYIEELHEAENSLLLSESYIPILDDDADNYTNDEEIDDEELDRYLSDEDISDDEINDLDDIGIDNNDLFDDEGIIN